MNGQTMIYLNFHTSLGLSESGITFPHFYRVIYYYRHIPKEIRFLSEGRLNNSYVIILFIYFQIIICFFKIYTLHLYTIYDILLIFYLSVSEITVLL